MSAIAFVGPVDHGKSTLIGRLLLESEALPKPEMVRLRQLERQVGMAGALVNLLDSLQEEREELFTLDTTRRVLGPLGGRLTIIDTPGHLELLTNMLTGASSADNAVLVLDPTQAIDDEARRYARVLSFLGLTGPGLVFTKLDLVEQPQALAELAITVTQLLAEYQVTPSFVTCASALSGTNVRKSDSQWPGLLPAVRSLAKIDELRVGADEVRESQFRMLIQGLEPDGAVAGRILAGSCKPGQKLMLYPQAQECRLQRILSFDTRLRERRSGDFAVLQLQSSTQNNGFAPKRGDVLCAPGIEMSVGQQWQMAALWLAEQGPELGQQVSVCCGCQTVEAQLTELAAQSAGKLSLWDVKLATRQPLVCELGFSKLSHVMLVSAQSRQSEQSVIGMGLIRCCRSAIG